ncbi:hypothetical protein CRENBAI_016726 [Crenichthys baileyi]|uniref:Uncharacterized protein n=1 Tax=Crenichthys baileyi TaxID=28760 RepID=A0AAV9QZY2_9TELE
MRAYLLQPSCQLAGKPPVAMGYSTPAETQGRRRRTATKGTCPRTWNHQPGSVKSRLRHRQPCRTTQRLLRLPRQEGKDVIREVHRWRKHSEGPADASTPAPGLKVFQGFSESLVLVLVPESPDEGFEDEPPPDPVHVIEGFKEQLVLVLASEPIDEGFEDEAPPDPVSGEFKEQLVLVLVSKGPPDSVPVSGGPVGSVPVSSSGDSGTRTRTRLSENP